MAEPFIGQIQIWGCNFAPRNWAFCNGTLMSISSNTALFSLIGTIYGGDGRTNFALPNLQGSAPMNFGQGPGLSNRIQGQTAGSPTVTIVSATMPSHTHVLRAENANAAATTPANNNLAKAGTAKRGGGFDPIYVYGPSNNLTPMATAAVTPNSGGPQAHDNMQPYLALNFCIALYGVFPSRN